MTQRNKNAFYIDNVKFTEETIKWISAYKEDNTLQLSPYLGRSVIMIAHRLANMNCFNNYAFKDEMISDGIENCVRYFAKYDAEAISKRTGQKSAGAFGYYSQICYHSFVRRINTEKKHMYIKQKYIATAMDDIIVMQEHETVSINEEISNIVREMSGNEYLEYDIKISEKKAEMLLNTILKDAKENVPDIMMDHPE